LRQDALVLETQSKIREEAEDAIRQTNGRHFILGTGCVVPITAAHGNYMAALESVRGANAGKDQ
jgi:uroporphyrinogen decarboxylase